ncbi:hypothetical protein NQ317_001009, partial [Molorchus minor]
VGAKLLLLALRTQFTCKRRVCKSRLLYSTMSYKIASSERLIECVREFEVLYNTDMKEYSDASLKIILWRQVAEKCKLPSGSAMNTTENVKKQENSGKNLRDGYRCSLKTLASKSGEAAKKLKPWKFSEEMSFLRPYMKDRQRSTNITHDEDHSLISEADIDENSQESKYDRNDHDSDNFISVIQLESVQKVKKLDYLRDLGNKREVRAQEGQQMRNEVMQSSQDSLKLFFDSMYLSAKKLPPSLQRMVKDKLFQAVMEAELLIEAQKLDIIANWCMSEGLSVNSKIVPFTKRRKLTIKARMMNGTKQELFEEVKYLRSKAQLGCSFRQRDRGCLGSKERGPFKHTLRSKFNDYWVYLPGLRSCTMRKHISGINVEDPTSMECVKENETSDQC